MEKPNAYIILWSSSLVTTNAICFCKGLSRGWKPDPSDQNYELWFYYKYAIIVICDIVKLGFKITFLSSFFLVVFYQLLLPQKSIILNSWIDISKIKHNLTNTLIQRDQTR